MPTWPTTSSEIKFTYVGPDAPLDPVEGESWLDTDATDGEESKVYTGSTWRRMTVTEHAQLAGIVEDAHHNPVSVEGPLRLSSGQVLDLAASDGLTLDADGRLRVAAGSVTQSMLAFDPVTQSDITKKSIINKNRDISISAGGQATTTLLDKSLDGVFIDRLSLSVDSNGFSDVSLDLDLTFSDGTTETISYSASSGDQFSSSSGGSHTSMDGPLLSKFADNNTVTHMTLTHSMSSNSSSIGSTSTASLQAEMTHCELTSL